MQTPAVSDEDRALYRIHTVAEMTGIAAATLRAWERRYGIPTPGRTAAAYRLYSARDIAMIRQVRALCDGGIGVSEAARMVQERATERETLRRAPVVEVDADAFVTATQRIVEAALRFAPQELEAEVQRATMLGGARDVFERAFTPAMRKIGDLWHEGRLSIAQEHLASTMIEAATRDLVRTSKPSAPTARAVFACFAGEDHALGLLGVALVAQSLGVRVVELGARTPPTALAHAVTVLMPDFVCLSSTIAPEPEEAAELVAAYAEACGQTPWVVGGLGGETMRALIEARGGLVPGRDEVALAQALSRAIRDGQERPRGRRR